jgi:inositol-1,3,4-trisphosphate 5/6-kinase/inositol-tetrakisphosphate 1-kinase
MDDAEVEHPVIEPDEEKMFALVSVMRRKFEVDLLGIDVIIENRSGRYAVIDINPFPG